MNQSVLNTVYGKNRFSMFEIVENGQIEHQKRPNNSTIKGISGHQSFQKSSVPVLISAKGFSREVTVTRPIKAASVRACRPE